MIRVTKVSDNFFPEIDFSLKNSGGSAALISSFALHILAARIDPTPVLNFHYTVDERRFLWRGDSPGDWEGDASLSLIINNNGWGPAEEYRLLFSEPALDLLFPIEARTLTCRVDSLASATLKLDPKAIDQSYFARVHRQLLDMARFDMEKKLPEFLRRNSHMTKGNGYEHGEIERSYAQYQEETRGAFERSWYRPRGHPWSLEATEERVPTIPLHSPIVTWSCSDNHDRQHSGTSTVGSPNPDGGSLYLTATGFSFDPRFLAKCALVSDRTYCVLIDPDQAPQQRTYTISRQIPAAGVDRFHIRVGATKSCEATIQFEFVVDGDKVIKSNPFEMKIWNPAGSWNHGFADGDEILRGNSVWEKESLHSFPFLDTADRGLGKSLRF
ncbi:hypothetical protein GFM01_30550 [Rhizobium laguerreae]|uniref:hypothetical protein n=1 Tax=Rhizobium laguerreae TaxID=1076926 RepID=UPI0014425C42|nr:hypothetical protein [Rhizobium laguerreae]NKM22027.1 hypothetical protein [Rhizobium laguerreae]